jgi:arylsulfatase
MDFSIVVPPKAQRMVRIGDRQFNSQLMCTGKGSSRRRKFYYFAESILGAARVDDFNYRFIDQPSGWLGGKKVMQLQIKDIK